MDNHDRLSDEQHAQIRRIIEKLELLPETHQAAFNSLIGQLAQELIDGTAPPVNEDQLRQELDALIALYKSVDEDP